MKPLHLATVGLFAGIGIGMSLGWMWRGARENTAMRSSAANTTEASDVTAGGSGSAANQGATAKLDEKSAGKQATKSPRDEARRILLNMLNEDTLRSGPPVEIFDFLQALAGCTAGELGALLDEVDQARESKTKEGRGASEVSMMVLARLANLDPEAAFSRFLDIQKAGGRMDSDFLVFLLSSAAKKDPGSVPGFIERMPDEQTKSKAQQAWMMIRAQQDPEGVLEEIANSTIPSGDEWRMSRLIRSAAAKFPEKAIKAARKLPEGQAGDSAVKEIVAQWVVKDPAAAANWSMQNNDAAGLAACLNANPPVLEAATVRQQFEAISSGTRQSRNELAGALAKNLAKTDTQQALSFANSLTGEEQSTAQSQLGSAWVEKDPFAAAEWLKTLPEGSARENVAAALVEKIHDSDPEGALAWATTVKGPQRVRSLESALAGMAAKDPAAAATAAKALPDYDRAALMKGKSQALFK